MKGAVLKTGAAFVMSAAFFFFGYQYAAALYTKDIEQMRRDYAERSRIMEEKYRATEQKQTQALVAAWQERDAALARVSSLSDDVDRVRREADAARRRLSGAGTDTCAAERKQLARSAGLLERCGCLLERGVRVSSRAAIDKDAIIKMAQ